MPKASVCHSASDRPVNDCWGYRDALVSVYLNSVIKNNQSSDISNPPKATVMTTNTKSPDVFTKRHYQPCPVKNNAVNGPEKGRNLQDEVKDNLSKAAVTITSNAKDVKSTEAVKVNNVWWPPSKIIPSNVKYINPVNDPIEIDCEDDDNSGNTTLQQKKKLVILIDDETDIDDKDAKKEKNLTAHSMTSITQLLNSDVNSKHRLNFETDARPRYTYSVEKKNIDLDPVSPQVKSNTPAIVSKTNQLNKDVKRRTKLTEYAAESAPFLSSVAVQKQSLVSSTGDHISTAVASKDKDIIISETTASMPMSEIDTNSAIASKEKNIVSEPTAFMPISEMDTNSTVASKDKDIIIISEPTASVSISEIDTNATSGIVLLEAFSLQPEFDASEYSTDDLEHGTTKQHHVPQDHQLALSRKAFFCCGLNGCTFATIMPVELEVHQLQFHSRSSHFDCVHCGYVASKPSLLIDHLHGHIYPDNEMDKFDGHCNYSNCSYKPVSYKDLLYHISQRHYRETSHPCLLCKEVFATCLRLMNHLRRNILTIVKCPHCSAKGITKINILKHITQNHPGCNRVVNVFQSIVCQERKTYNWPCIFKEKSSDNLAKPSYNNSLLSLSLEKQQQLREELHCVGFNMVVGTNPPGTTELSENCDQMGKENNVLKSASLDNEVACSHTPVSDKNSKQCHLDNTGSSEENLDKSCLTKQQTKPDSELPVKCQKKRMLKCKECNLVSSHCGFMYKHIRRKHEITDMVICEVCKLSLPTNKIMDHHGQYHIDGDEDYIPTALSDAFEIFWEERPEEVRVNKKRSKKCSFKKKPVLERNIVEKITDDADADMDNHDESKTSIMMELGDDGDNLESSYSDKRPTAIKHRNDSGKVKTVQKNRKRKRKPVFQEENKKVKFSETGSDGSVASQQNRANLQGKRVTRSMKITDSSQKEISVEVKKNKINSEKENDTLVEHEQNTTNLENSKPVGLEENTIKMKTVTNDALVEHEQNTTNLENSKPVGLEVNAIKMKTVTNDALVEHEQNRTNLENSKAVGLEENTVKMETVTNDTLVEHEQNTTNLENSKAVRLEENTIKMETVKKLECFLKNKTDSKKEESVSLTENKNPVGYVEMEKPSELEKNTPIIQEISAGLKENNTTSEQKENPTGLVEVTTDLENRNPVGHVEKDTGTQGKEKKKCLGLVNNTVSVEKETLVGLVERTNSSQKEITCDLPSNEVKTEVEPVALPENKTDLEKKVNLGNKSVSVKERKMSLRQKSFHVPCNKHLVLRLKKTDIKIPFPLQSGSKLEVKKRASSVPLPAPVPPPAPVPSPAPVVPPAPVKIQKCVGIKEEDCPDAHQFLHSDFEFRCKYCTHRGESFTKFIHHLYYHFHYKKYACSYCSFAGFSQNRLLTHVGEVHPKYIKKPNILITNNSQMEKRCLDLCHFCFVPKLKDDVELRQRLARKKLKLAGKLKIKQKSKTKVLIKKEPQKKKDVKKGSVLNKVARLTKHLSNGQKRFAGETGGHMCPYCRENRPLMSWLRLHIEICYHIHYKPLNCGYCCKMQTASILRLTKHNIKEHPGKKVKCVTCLDKSKEEKLKILVNRSVQLSKRYNKVKSGQLQKTSSGAENQKIGWKVLKYSKVAVGLIKMNSKSVCEKGRKKPLTGKKEETSSKDISKHVPAKTSIKAEPQSCSNPEKTSRGSLLTPDPPSRDDHSLMQYRIYKTNELFKTENDGYGDPFYQCIKCEYTIRNLKSMYTHSYRHQPQIFKCGYCDFRGYPRSQIGWHLKTVHHGKPQKVIDIRQVRDEPKKSPLVRNETKKSPVVKNNPKKSPVVKSESKKSPKICDTNVVTDCHVVLFELEQKPKITDIKLEQPPEVTDVRFEQPSKITDITLEQSPGVTNIKLEQSPEVTDIGLQQLPEVTDIILEQPPEVTDIRLEQLPNVSDIRLEQPPKVTDTGLKQQPEVTDIGCKQPPKVSDIEFEQPPEVTNIRLEQPPKVTDIRLEQLPEVTDIRLEQLPEVTNIRLEEPPKVTDKAQATTKSN